MQTMNLINLINLIDLKLCIFVLLMTTLIITECRAKQ